MTLAMRDTPYRTDHESSVNRGMERGKQPRTLEGLLRWFVVRFAEETPEKLHISEPWHDSVSNHEREDGITPVGGSHLGSLAWSGPMRTIMQVSASVTDEDGYYVTPMRAALSRMQRRRPFMVRNLCAVAMASGNWQQVADRKPGWTHEEYADYLERALVLLWQDAYDRTTKGLV